MWSESLPHQVLVLSWDKFESQVWEAASNCAEEAVISSKGDLNKYLRRAQIGTATKQSAAMLVLLDIAQLLQPVSKKKRQYKVLKTILRFEIKEDVH